MFPRRYRIAPDQSTVLFRADSSLHPIVAQVHPTGWFSAAIEGSRFVEGEPFDGYLEIAVRAIRSGNPLLDREARRRVEEKDHPKISCRLAHVLHVEEETAMLEGTVDFAGVEVTVEGEIRLVAGDPDPVIKGEGVFDLGWWNVEAPRLLMLSVDPEVLVRIHLVLEADEDG